MNLIDFYTAQLVYKQIGSYYSKYSKTFHKKRLLQFERLWST